MLNKIKIRSIKNILFRGNDSYLSNIPLTVSIHRAVTEKGGGATGNLIPPL